MIMIMPMMLPKIIKGMKQMFKTMPKQKPKKAMNPAKPPDALRSKAANVASAHITGTKKSKKGMYISSKTRKYPKLIKYLFAL